MEQNKVRIFSGLVAATLLIGSLLIAKHYQIDKPVFTLILLISSILCFKEYHAMFAEKSEKQITSLEVFLSFLFILSLFWEVYFATFTMIFLLFLNHLGKAGYDPEGLSPKQQSIGLYLFQLMIFIFGLVYIGILIYFPFLILTKLNDGFLWLFFLFITVWVTDTGAYFMGRKLGRRKLTPIISPGKTIEGLLGGMLITTLACYLYRCYYFPELPITRVLFLGLFGSFFAQYGDIFESFIKRSVGLKDSGSFLPGHGGLLDRIDGFLFTAPFIYHFVNSWQKIP